jgi:hypothetical protein
LMTRTSRLRQAVIGLKALGLATIAAVIVALFSANASAAATTCIDTANAATSHASASVKAKHWNAASNAQIAVAVELQDCLRREPAQRTPSALERSGALFALAGKYAARTTNGDDANTLLVRAKQIFERILSTPDLSQATRNRIALEIRDTDGALQTLAYARRQRSKVPYVACFGSHCDTQLDISHSDITASLVGCDAHEDDAVSVNGLAEDGIQWSLIGIRPATASSPAQIVLRLMPADYNGLTLIVGKCSFPPKPLAVSELDTREIVLKANASDAAEPTPRPNLAGVYGFLPSSNVRVYLQSAGSEPITAIVVPHEGAGMFYFDAVIPGTYVMTVSGDGWSKSLGEIIVDRPGDLVMKYVHGSEIAH